MPGNYSYRGARPFGHGRSVGSALAASRNIDVVGPGCRALRAGTLGLTAAAAATALYASAFVQNSYALSSPIAECVALDDSNSGFVGDAAFPPSDPGPTFVRQELVELLLDLFGSDLGPRDVQVAIVGFGTDATVVTPLTPITDPATRTSVSELVSEAVAVPAGWSSLDYAVDRCVDVLRSAPTTARKRILILSDGRPERPGVSNEFMSDATLAAADRARASGIVVDTVAYGAAANGGDENGKALMAEIADRSGGEAFVASDTVHLLQVAVELAAERSGSSITGHNTSVNGLTEIPFVIDGNVEALTMIALRGNLTVTLTLRTPEGTILTPSEDGHYATFGQIQPNAGEYILQASGIGDVAAFALVRYRPLLVPTPTSPAGARTTAVAPTPGDTIIPQNLPKAGSGAPDWIIAAIAVPIASIATVGLLVRRRRRLRLPGTITVRANNIPRTTEARSLVRPQLLRDLLPAAAAAASVEAASGWRLAARRGSVYLWNSDEEFRVPPGEVIRVPQSDVSVLYASSWHPA